MSAGTAHRRGRTRERQSADVEDKERVAGVVRVSTRSVFSLRETCLVCASTFRIETDDVTRQTRSRRAGAATGRNGELREGWREEIECRGTLCSICWVSDNLPAVRSDRGEHAQILRL